MARAAEWERHDGKKEFKHATDHYSCEVKGQQYQPNQGLELHNRAKFRSKAKEYVTSLLTIA
jgi:hypothetical protein